MKRCPQCEFIYEDSQSLCDMDGRDLVYDIRPLQGSGATAKSGATTKPASRRSAAAFIGIVLAVVVLAIGYASVEQTLSQNSDFTLPPAITDKQQSSLHPGALTPAAVATPSVNQAPREPVGPSETPDQKAYAARSQSLTRKRRETSSTPEKVVVKNESTPGKPVTRPRKGSKISSLFKKTKRILSKPF